jgi:hypothetical protein
VRPLPQRGQDDASAFKQELDAALLVRDSFWKRQSDGWEGRLMAERLQPPIVLIGDQQSLPQFAVTWDNGISSRKT